MWEIWRKHLIRRSSCSTRGSMLSRRGTLSTTTNASAMTSISGLHVLEKGALEGGSTINKHGCALQPKDSSDDVPKSGLNVESVEGTTNKDTGNSMSSDSNVEGAPPSEKESE